MQGIVMFLTESMNQIKQYEKPGCLNEYFARTVFHQSVPDQKLMIENSMEEHPARNWLSY
jgi:hypothetical protein